MPSRRPSTCPGIPDGLGLTTKVEPAGGGEGLRGGEKGRRKGAKVKVVSRPLEKVVQADVMATIRRQGLWCMRNNSGAAVVGKGKDRRFFKFGEPGSADVFSLMGGRLFVVEVKRKGEKLDKHQLEWLLARQEEGAIVMWTDDADEFAEQLRGLLAGGRCRLGVDGIMVFDWGTDNG
jgi:hypothetical protein